MKKPLITLSLAVLAASLCIFIACSKTSSSSNTGNSNPNDIPADKIVTASVQGRVVDENGVPVQGAVVSSGSATAATDVNGIFSFTNISLSSRFGYVKVTKQGYFTGSRSIITNAGASNYVNIQLIPRTAKGTFPSATGGKVVVGTGDTVSFGGGVLVNAATNAAYSGTVHVYAAYLNPTDPGLGKYMPGDLRGIGSDGNETALQSFGMMVVELEDDGGNKLQVAGGQQATLTFSIPDTLVAAAPASIPLWYFNDTTGRWIQQGTAVRQGNNYVGQVSHFTFWNCDAPIGTVNFTVHLKDQWGNALAYTYIQFVSQAYGTRGGYTDSTGFAQGLIPKGLELQMQVQTECGNFIGGFNVGPAVQDQNMGTIVVTISHTGLTLTGTVVNCSNNPVDSGYVNVLIDGLNYRAAISNGAFTLPINRCYVSSTKVQLLAVDLATGQQSNVASVAADSGTVGAGQLTACSAGQSQYINFSIGGVQYSITTPSGSLSEYVYNYNNMTVMNGTGSNTNAQLMITGLTATGSYNDSILVAVPGGGYNGRVNYTVTAYGPVGSYITGSFTGPATGPGNQTITGQFLVQRTNTAY